MSRAQVESVIKNIIREIAQECVSKGQAVSETLIAFMVKSVVLDPANAFNVDRTLTKDDVQKLIKICVGRLIDTNTPALDTVKLQVYFDMNYTTRGEFLEEHRNVLESRLQPVIREVTDTRARTRDELESLYRKIVSAVLLRSGLGSPTDLAVVREATAALQSVFPQTELGSFMSLMKRDKQRQLQELTKIITGIRLFNKECGKGGEGIDDLPAILNEAVPATTQNVDASIQQTCMMAHRYTAVIEHMYESQEVDQHILLLMKEALINCRQHEAFLRVVLHDVISCAQQVELLESQLASRMEQLQATVQSKTAVPTAQVYPQFIHLAQIWSGFQDEMVLLSVLSNILVSMEPYTRVHRDIFSEEFMTQQVAELTVWTDEQRIQRTMGQEHRLDCNKDTTKKYEWLYPETTKNFSKLPLQYRGYCAWALVKFDRFILPANPSIGVIRYKENCYAFSSKKAAEEFARNPDEYIRQMAEAAKRSPELIQLLELHNQFASITPYSQGKDRGKMIEKPLTKCDNSTQTDTHFVETNIVASYEWNEWELRRKALKLANLRTKVTHSAQTILSNMRRDGATQVYLPKDAALQTLADNYTNVPKPQVFVHGLRGCTYSFPTKMEKIDLTIDIDQT